MLAIGNGIRSDRTPSVATVLAASSDTGGNLAVDLTPKPDRVGGPLVNHLGQAVGIVTDSAPPHWQRAGVDVRGPGRSREIAAQGAVSSTRPCHSRSDENNLGWNGWREAS